MVQTLKRRLTKLAPGGPGDLPDLSANLPDPANWDLTGTGQNGSSTVCQTYRGLIDQLEQCQAAAFELSDHISRRYFSHASSGNQSFGA